MFCLSLSLVHADVWQPPGNDGLDPGNPDDLALINCDRHNLESPHGCKTRFLAKVAGENIQNAVDVAHLANNLNGQILRSLLAGLPNPHGHVLLFSKHSPCSDSVHS